MSLRLGTVGPVGFADFNPPSWLECMKRLGCEAVQAYRNPQAGLSAEQIKQSLAAGGMPCDSIHTNYGPQYDPSAPDEPARRLAVENLKCEGRLASRLGGRIAVVHCSDLKSQGVSAAERTLRIDMLKKSIAELGQFGWSIGISYAFENLSPAHPIGGNVAELAGLLCEVNAPSAGMCFDVAHANLAGDPVKAVGETRGKIIYVHLSDNFGKTDDHKMPGHGSIDCKAVLTELVRCGYGNTIMLEVFYSEQQLKELIAAGFAGKLSELLEHP